MSDLNEVFLVGRLTKDAEMSMTKNEKYCFKFSIAFSRSVKNEKDEWEDKTSFIDCVYFTKKNMTLFKADKVFINGYLEENVWQDKNTDTTRRQMRLYCNEVQKIVINKPKKEENVEKEENENQKEVSQEKEESII